MQSFPESTRRTIFFKLGLHPDYMVYEFYATSSFVQCKIRTKLSWCFSFSHFEINTLWGFTFGNKEVSNLELSVLLLISHLNSFYLSLFNLRR